MREKHLNIEVILSLTPFVRASVRPSHCGPEQPKTQTKVLGHSLVRLLALHTRFLTSLIPLLVRKWMIGWFFLCFSQFWPIVHLLLTFLLLSGVLLLEDELDDWIFRLLHHVHHGLVHRILKRQRNWQWMIQWFARYDSSSAFIGLSLTHCDVPDSDFFQ